jgi:hypothetical protein
MQADSVAVNQPNTFPPTMMNGVVKAGADTANALNSAAQVARG